MLLKPKKTKFRKMQKGRNKGQSRSYKIKFGQYGLKSLSRGNLTAKQIEAARRVLSHTTKRQSKVWIRIFPDKPITRKPIEVRMGKGKGNVEYWVSVIKPGTILYEMNCIDKNLAQKAFKLASAKLPLKTIFVENEYV